MNQETTLELLETKIEELRELSKSKEIDLSDEIARLEARLETTRAELYDNLTDWERVKLARHPKRPYSLDYVGYIFDGFYELHGDRLAGDDHALLTGFARLDGRKVAIIAQQKGRSTEENKKRNFGMPCPQGYRKAKRIMRLAEKFSFPVISLIDTPGAYPGLEAERYNIGGAIADNLSVMAKLRVPIIAAIIGEGGSGGALAIGVADRILMLENATYSVISPEGASAILWKNKAKVKQAAQALNLTAAHLLELGIIDQLIPEPIGGAHRDLEQTASSLKKTIVQHLSELRNVSVDKLVKNRYERYRSVGRFQISDNGQQKD